MLTRISMLVGRWVGGVFEPSYLLSDLGGNSNSPTEMVSTALREIRITCWQIRLMKSYLHTSKDLQQHTKIQQHESVSPSVRGVVERCECVCMCVYQQRFLVSNTAYTLTPCLYRVCVCAADIRTAAFWCDGVCEGESKKLSSCTGLHQQPTALLCSGY